MAFFPANFMLQSQHHHHHQDEHQAPPSLNSILTSCAPQEYHGLGKRSMSFSGIEVGEVDGNGGEEEVSDDGSQAGEKKRRLNMEQVKTLEKSFELGNKLEPERKMQLARALGLQPRQIAIWFQNRRARWKTKQLEKDYDLLKRQFEAVKADNDALQAQNHKLHTQIMALKSREPTESINLNKETEGSSSNRSENSSDIKLDISTRTPTTTSAIDSPLSTHHNTNNNNNNNNSRTLFPSPSNNNNNAASAAAAAARPTEVAQLFQTAPHHHHHHHHHHMVKEESLSNMFCAIDDQSGLWPWLEHQNFN